MFTQSIPDHWSWRALNLQGNIWLVSLYDRAPD